MTAIPLRERPRWQVALGVWHLVAWVLAIEWGLTIGGAVLARLAFGVDTATAARTAGYAVLSVMVGGLLAGFVLDLRKGSTDDL